MKWYYVENGQQAGPVEDTEFPQLVRAGKLRADTFVWREGMVNWEPFSKACPDEFAATTASFAAGTEAVCAECGGMFDKNEMIPHGSAFICAKCKPVFMQKLSEGGNIGGYRTPGSLSVEDLLARDYDVDVGGYISRAWAMFKANPGGIIGASVLVYLAMMIPSFIPYLGILCGFFLTGPLFGGLWMYYLKCSRQQHPVVGDAFSGFGPRYWQLVLAQLIPNLLGIAAMFFAAMIAALVIPAIAMSSRNAGGSSISPVWLILLGLVVIAAGIVVIYFSVCWFFALPLVADKGMTFWPAMQLSRRIVIKHWWLTLWLVILGGLIAMLGMIACFVGTLVSGPVAFGMFTCHYERVFGELAQQA